MAPLARRRRGRSRSAGPNGDAPLWARRRPQQCRILVPALLLQAVLGVLDLLDDVAVVVVAARGRCSSSSSPSPPSFSWFKNFWREIPPTCRNETVPPKPTTWRAPPRKRRFKRAAVRGADAFFFFPRAGDGGSGRRTKRQVEDDEGGRALACDGAACYGAHGVLRQAVRYTDLLAHVRSRRRAAAAAARPPALCRHPRVWRKHPQKRARLAGRQRRRQRRQRRLHHDSANADASSCAMRTTRRNLQAHPLSSLAVLLLARSPARVRRRRHDGREHRRDVRGGQERRDLEGEEAYQVAGGGKGVRARPNGDRAERSTGGG